jgi:hypothetical protein
MKINIYDLLPEKISDESAYHLVNFFTNLATELESHYFAQMKRHIDDNRLSDIPSFLHNKPDDEILF